jgi:hypothetical protein
MEEDLLETVVQSWDVYKRYLSENEKAEVPENLEAVDKALVKLYEEVIPDIPDEQCDWGKGCQWDKE